MGSLNVVLLVFTCIVSSGRPVAAGQQPGTIGRAPVSVVETALAHEGARAQEEAVALETPTGTIHGTLLLPDRGEAPYPVVLIIAGSGPTDRDGNTQGLPGRNDSLKLLAQGLAARGVASVRYDKRGIGASAPAAISESDLRFEYQIDDAVGWIRMLRDDRRFSTVTVVGHSEGSLIGMVAARQAEADAFVSVAGAGRPAADLLRDQLAGNLPPALLEEAESILATLEAGHLPDSVSSGLVALFRPSVLPYLVSWFRYDPAAELARLEIPVLIAQGTTDVQVDTAEARILADARPSARLLIVEGMNHVLKEAYGDRFEQLRTAYVDPSLPVVRELVEGIADFVTARD